MVDNGNIHKDNPIAIILFFFLSKFELKNGGGGSIHDMLTLSYTGSATVILSLNDQIGNVVHSEHTQTEIRFFYCVATARQYIL